MISRNTPKELAADMLGRDQPIIGKKQVAHSIQSSPRKTNASKRQRESHASLPPAKAPRVHPSSDIASSRKASHVPESAQAPLPTDPLADILKNYQLNTIHVKSGSNIQKCVTKALDSLATFSFLDIGAKPNLVKLHAKAPTASKMTSIAEIAKREIATAGAKWYQYTVLTEELDARKAKKQAKEEQHTEDQMDLDGDAEMEDESFETMKTPFERAVAGQPKVRFMPLVTIYLSRVSISELKQQYGEQSNYQTR